MKLIAILNNCNIIQPLYYKAFVYAIVNLYDKNR